MKTAEEFLKDQLNVFRLSPLQWSGILKAMEEYASQALAELKAEMPSDESTKLLKWAFDLSSFISSKKTYAMRFPELNSLACAIEDYLEQIKQ